MISLEDIAKEIEGELIGDGNIFISGISGIEEAKEGEITFVIQKGYEKYLYDSHASAFIVSNSTLAERFGDRNFIIVKNPGYAYIKVAKLFETGKKIEPGISPLAFISEGVDIAQSASISPFVYIGKHVKIEENVCVYPFVYIGDGTHVGSDTVIYPGVTIYDRTEIGKRVVIHGGTVIGSDGFGYTWDGKRHVKIPQLGIVVIEDDVEIGANVTIDRASLDKTIIKRDRQPCPDSPQCIHR